MNKAGVLGFLAGATVASAITYVLTKRIIQAKCDQEINEVRDFYAAHKNTVEELSEIKEEVPNEEENKKPEKPELSAMAARVRYDRVLSNYGSGNSEALDEEDQEVVPDIEVITEDDFVHTEYERRSLTYYAGDDTLVDDDDGEVIDDVQNTIGRDSLNKFVEGVVHIRNNKSLKDFEVAEDPRSYEDVAADIY